MYLLGVDIGSSSVKVSLIDGENGNCVASSFHPKQEMKIMTNAYFQTAKYMLSHNKKKP